MAYISSTIDVREPRVPTLAWAACDAGRCASAAVPLDYDDPAGPTITLSIVKVAATDPAQRIGSLFINPGSHPALRTQSVHRGRRTAVEDYLPPRLFGPGDLRATF
jgi:hypothetical protein